MKKIPRRLLFIAIILLALVYFASVVWVPRWLFTGNTGFSWFENLLDKYAMPSDVDL